MNELTKNWQENLKGIVNHKIRTFLEVKFRAAGIKKPKLINIAEIDNKEITDSWLTQQSQKDLMLFQQQIKNQ